MLFAFLERFIKREIISVHTCSLVFEVRKWRKKIPRLIKRNDNPLIVYKIQFLPTFKEKSCREGQVFKLKVFSIL